MKKWFKSFLAVLMLTAALTACGSDSGADVSAPAESSPTASSSEVQSTPAEEKAPVEEEPPVEEAPEQPSSFVGSLLDSLSDQPEEAEEDDPAPPAEPEPPENSTFSIHFIAQTPVLNIMWFF